MLVPFLLAIITGLLFFRQRDLSSAAMLRYHGSRGVLASDPVPCSAGWGCSHSGSLASEPELMSGEGTVDSDAVGPSAGGPASSLPPLFLFVGILSGRGYRHRRLAVREAWSNRAQIPGEVVSKFVLSDDERTPQVQKEVDTYGDIVFVREKTNYKSILYKTYYVSGGRRGEAGIV